MTAASCSSPAPSGGGVERVFELDGGGRALRGRRQSFQPRPPAGFRFQPAFPWAGASPLATLLGFALPRKVRSGYARGRKPRPSGKMSATMTAPVDGTPLAANWPLTNHI